MGSTVDRSALAAFAGIVLFGGLNAVAIKFTYEELAPFWGAALRFGIAALLLFALVGLRRVALPRGRALIASLLYGVLGFGVFYALTYWGLIETPAGLAMILLATVPLLTLLLAVAHGQERFRAQGAVGSLLAIAGIVVVFGERALGASGDALPHMLAVLLASVALAETGVIVKGFPRSHPLANNAVAMAVGAAMLLVTSLIAGEPFVLPIQADTWAALAYLVLLGSVAMFMFFLYVIERWTASATSYTLLLMPLVTAVAAAVALAEPITVTLVVGGTLVVAGVYVGAFAPSLSTLLPGLVRRAEPATEPATEAAAPGPPTLERPGCP